MRRNIILISILLCGMVLSWILYPDRASSGPYLDSAHGNTSYGVKRSATGFPADYAKGNCAHCHEQHASIGGAEPDPAGGPDKFLLMSPNFSGKTVIPYIQSDSVCFYCHYGSGTLQSPAFNNYSYSITFGGNPDATPNNIFNTFNSTSYHNLYDVYRFIAGLSGSKSFPNFPADSNPCSGCHNVHIAKKSCGKPAGSYDPTKSAISRPTGHDSLWGDDDIERLKTNFTSYYQSPYWYGSWNYEPNNSPVYDGSNLPDYNTFCTDCHNNTNIIYSTALGRYLRAIDWVTPGGETGGDKHGKNDATNGIDIDNPYASSPLGISVGFVLACTDCHEPHGAPNVMLIRQVVNGGVLYRTISSVTPTAGDCTPPFPAGSKELGYLCNRCHMDDADAFGGTANKWCYIHHESTDRPYPLNQCGFCHSGGDGGGGGGESMSCETVSRNPINCNCCHFHGSDDNAAPDGRRTNRRTF
jgi:hypothetical protein